MLFFDTDAELSERPPSRLAIAVAKRAVLLVSSDWRAYTRLKADGRNSIFRFLLKLKSEGSAHAKIDMLLFNNVEKLNKDCCDVPAPANFQDKTPPPLKLKEGEVAPPTPPTELHLFFTPIQVRRACVLIIRL